MNHTDLRILKEHRRGLTPEQIARKIGRPGDVQRVREALERAGLKFPAGQAVQETMIDANTGDKEK